jgi:hypothetical protein
VRTPSIKAYYAALQEQFRLQSNVLSDVLPHAGERGRNNEEHFRDFLARVLPKKYSVGSGFIVCSERTVPASSQTDIVIYDEFHNAPIHRELASAVFPVEMVYATVEVKRRLEKRSLAKILADIAKVRALGKHRYYINYAPVPKSPETPERLVVGRSELRMTVPPRAFVFAYEQSGWHSASELAESLREASRDHPAHIHGLAVLRSDWHISQEAHAGPTPRYITVERDALLRFINGMLHSIGSVKMSPMSVDRYLNDA